MVIQFDTASKKYQGDCSFLFCGRRIFVFSDAIFESLQAEVVCDSVKQMCGEFLRYSQKRIDVFQEICYIIEATKKANPNGEADMFLAAMKELGFID